MLENMINSYEEQRIRERRMHRKVGIMNHMGVCMSVAGGAVGAVSMFYNPAAGGAVGASVGAVCGKTLEVKAWNKQRKINNAIQVNRIDQ